jgi:hypothetical protein
MMTAQSPKPVCPKNAKILVSKLNVESRQFVRWNTTGHAAAAHWDFRETLW